MPTIPSFARIRLSMGAVLRVRRSRWVVGLLAMIGSQALWASCFYDIDLGRNVCYYPTVSLTSPVNGLTAYVPPATVTISATAAPNYMDQGSVTIARVEFYNGTTLLQTVTTPPYSITLSGLAPGTYAFKARAIDSGNNGTTSTTSTVTVVANQVPTGSVSVTCSTPNCKAPTTLTATVAASDADDGVARVELFRGGVSQGAKTSAPFSWALTGVGVGTYSFNATVTDTRNAVGTSGSVSATVNANTAPAVAITSPTNGATLEPSPVTLSVSGTTSDSDGSVANVELLVDGQVRASLAGPPATFTLNASAVAAGAHSVQLRATDDNGAQTLSGAITVNVATGNRAQFLSASVPTLMVAGQSYPVSVTFKNTGSSTWTTANSYKLGAENPADNTTWGFSRTALSGAVPPGASSTISFNVTAPASGSYNFQWRMLREGVEWFGDASNNTVVRSNAAPSAAVTAPTGGSYYKAPAAITFNASASDPDGTISKVEYWNGSTKIGEATTAPYAFTWTNVAVGSYSVSARPIDNDGTPGAGSSVSFTVGTNVAPIATLLAPADGAVYQPGANLTLAAKASDSDGSIGKVEFYDRSTLLGTGTLSNGVYRLSWSSPATGTHVITAKATDDNSTATTSASATISVIAASAIVPPNLSGSVSGSIAGGAGVSEQGAATYAVPIVVPPGTAGMAPQLSLQYNSQSGASILGEGWSVAGLSSITRCPRTLAVDGVAGKVGLDGNDRYCLDGQRLILVSGAYGANAEYRTEVDGLSRVTSYGSDASKGPNYWKVENKGGQILYFGNTADSYVEAQGTTKPLSWAINRIEDRRGNYLTIEYIENTVEGEHYPKQVRYTGNGALVPYNALRFEYESSNRADPAVRYVAGAKVSTLKRLEKLSTWINTAADGTGGSLVQEMRVAYTQNAASSRSLVDTLSQCDASGACLPSTRFTWQQRSTADNHFNAAGSGVWGGPTVSFSAGQQRSVQLVQAQVVMGDLNGDGRTDLLKSLENGTWQVCLSTGTGLNCQTWTGPNAKQRDVLTGDFNGDGRLDLAAPPNINAASAAWRICLSTGSAFSCEDWSGPGIAFSTVSMTVSSVFSVGEFTGDGRDDVMTGSKLCRSTGSSFDCADYWNGQVAFDPFQDLCPENSTRKKMFSGDFNGDGRGDFLTIAYEQNCPPAGYVPNNGYVVCYAGDTGFSCVPAVSGLGADLGFTSSPGSMIADLNGDGYADFVLSQLSGGTTLKTCRFTGNGGAASCTDIVPGGSSYDAASTYLGDFDGDGRADTFHYSADTTARVCQVGATGLSCADWVAPLAPYRISGELGSFYGDFNGDGKTDLATYNEFTTKWTVWLTAGPKPDLLASVTDGLGHVTQLSYKPLTDSSVYTSDRGLGALQAAYPQRDGQDSTYVVSQLRASNGLGGWLTADYRYGGMKADMRGRGPLGFRWMEVTDGASHVTTRTEYLQSFPYARQVSLVTSTHANGVELRRQQNVWASLTSTAIPAIAGQSIVLPYVQSSTETTKELNGGAVTGVVTTTIPTTGGLDSYGNVLSSTQTSAAGGETLTTATTSTYDNLVAPWQIGLLRTTIVTRSASATSVTGSVTRQVGIDYDAYGQVSRETVEPNDPANKLITDYTRNGFGSVLTKTLNWTDPVSASAKSRKTDDIIYESKGRFPQTVKNALNHSETHGYDARTGNLLSLTGPNGLTTSWSYDGWGRKIREDRADGTATTWAYRNCVDTCLNSAVSVVVAQNWSGATQITVPTEIFSDRLRRGVLTRTWGFTGSAVLAEQQYDSLGQLYRVSRPYDAGSSPVWISYGYDDLGRRTSLTEPNASGSSQTSTTSYSGLSTTFTNAKSQTRTETRNLLGKLRAATDAANFTTNYQYDPFGNLKQTTDPKGNTIRVTYDKLGRKTQLADPDLGTWNYNVDPLGQTYKQTDAKSQITTYVFDELGRMTQRLEPDLDSRWVFDSATKGVGKLAEAYTRKGDGSKDYRRVLAYDSLARVASTTLSLDWDYTSTQTYDVYGRSVGTSHARNAVGTSGGPVNTIEYGYNGFGYLAQVRSARVDGVAKVEWKVTAQDAANRVTQEQLGNGLLTNRNYNSFTGRVAGISTGISSGSLTANSSSHQSDAYLYDALGNLEYRAQLISTGGALIQESMTYDSLNRLRTSQVGGQALKSFDFDEIGNLTSKSGLGTYAYPASGGASVRPHAVTGLSGTMNSVASPTFGYDANGNLVSGAGRTITPTSFNLPKDIVYTRSAPSASTLTDSFVYGPEHQRIRQSITPSSGTPLVPLRSVFYAGSIEKEVTTSQTRIKTYLPRGLGYLEEVIAGTSAAPTQSATVAARYAHSDRLGSVVVVTDENQATVERMSFDVWGKRRNNDGTDDLGNAMVGAADRTGYTGHEHLDAVNLIHMSGRVYDPITARFIAPDPTIPDPDDLQSLNRYSYVQNQPLYYVDPSGYRPEEADKNIQRIVLDSKEISGTRSLIQDGYGKAATLVSFGAKNPMRVVTTVAATVVKRGPQIAGRSLTASVFGPGGSALVAGVSGAMLVVEVIEQISEAAQADAGKDAQGALGANGDVTISDERAKHILEGDGPDKPGGGHRPGTGKPGKSEFPAGWSDEKIIDSIVGVANDPSSSRGPRQGNGNVPVRGTRDGVDIEVIVNPSNNTIVTGYPTNVRPNPR